MSQMTLAAYERFGCTSNKRLRTISASDRFRRPALLIIACRKMIGATLELFKDRICFLALVVSVLYNNIPITKCKLQTRGYGKLFLNSELYGLHTARHNTGVAHPDTVAASTVFHLCPHFELCRQE